MIIGTKVKSWLRLPSLRLGVTGKECQQCATCDKNCPMSLPVHTMVQRGSMENTECILCGTCVDNCPNKVIRFSWGYSNKARTA